MRNKRKKPFFTIKTKIFESPIKGVKPCFWSKNGISLFRFGQNNTRKNAQ